MADSDSDNSDSLLPQESQDLFADDLLLPSTDTIIDDPLQEASSQKHRLYCEDFLKDDTSDESIDSDVTPDLEFATTSNCDKDDKNEDSNNSVKMKKKTFWDSDDSD